MVMQNTKKVSDENRTTIANTGFASGGVTPFRASRGRLCKFGALCFYSSSAWVDSFVLRNRHLGVAANHYWQVIVR